MASKKKVAKRREHIETPAVSASSGTDAEEVLLYQGSPDVLEGTEYQPQEESGESGESEEVPPTSSSGKRKRQQEGRLRQLKFSEFENEALVEGLVPVYHSVIGKYATKTPTDRKTKAWKDIAEHVNSVGACLRNVHQCKKRYQDIKRCLKKKLAEESRYRSGTGGGPAKRVHYTRYEELLLPFLHRESVSGVSGTFDTDRNVGQDSSPPGPSRRRPTASAPVPGGRSSSGLYSPRCDPEIEGEGFSGEASERGSHVSGSGVAFSSDEEPANIPQQQQLPTQPTGENVAPREQAKNRFHKSLIMHHKALMRKMDQLHVDLCVVTNAYNAGQARQAAHESAMLSLYQNSEARRAQHEAKMESLKQARHAKKSQHEAKMESLKQARHEQNPNMRLPC
ncbi:uncharacterized protein LOC100498593 isoform X2 [Xenopus tropicalis]|uniref:Uncharacterized protein LOC100498593 isoform X2 n=1 Tax=Xenopus tropicalis TaxID=8364 RepID=A0A8J0SNU6_XENTR|nr:uncharacterized protein LOC100498593 isoform X2 [Xenopus tropicalis]|eukprot:XP_012820656.1 PREDICTED: uncharacterized protein LOC100498593 isoform X2 [Xenopus tropicalis]